MGIRIFTGAQNDLDAIRALHIEGYPNEEPDWALQHAQHNLTWVLEEDGKVVACLISTLNKRVPYIWSVVTFATHRGRGYASLLIKEFERHYKGAGYAKAWLHCRVSNPAQKVYFDLGYLVASFEPNMYGPFAHGMSMRTQFG